jgi:hypothetical protein
MTNGVYVWPEGIVHYLEEHCLDLEGEEAFVESVLEGGDCRYDNDCCEKKEWKMWDETTSKPVDIGKEDLLWLRKYTTLYNYRCTNTNSDGDGDSNSNSNDSNDNNDNNDSNGQKNKYIYDDDDCKCAIM